jgi:hypothetical protein
MPPISLGRVFNTPDIEARIKSRTRVYDSPTFVVYAWDSANDGMFEQRHYKTEGEAWEAARTLAAEFPTHKVTIYRLCVVIDPDRDGNGPYMPRL